MRSIKTYGEYRVPVFKYRLVICFVKGLEERATIGDLQRKPIRDVDANIHVIPEDGVASICKSYPRL